MNAGAAWAIGCYEDADGARVPWRISHDEMARDIAAAARSLQEAKLQGQHVLWCSMLSQAGQFWPYLCGTVLVGARLSCADATAAEAARVAMFLRLLPFGAVFGITGAVLDGLDELGVAYPDVFAGVRVLGAHGDAYTRLDDAGMAPVHFAVCGPVVAMAHEPGAPARVAGDDWLLDTDDDSRHIVVSNSQPRAQQFDRTATRVRGQIVDGGVVPFSNGKEP